MPRYKVDFELRVRGNVTLAARNEEDAEDSVVNMDLVRLVAASEHEDVEVSGIEEVRQG